MQKLIKYFNACYKSDNNSLVVSNFFGNSVENRLIFEEEQLINGKLPYYPIDEEYAETVLKKTKLYEKEKEFVYCSFFVLGKSRAFNNRVMTICSPLFIYKANIIKNDNQYFLEINKKDRKLNYALLNKINEGSDSTEILFDQLHKNIAEFEIDETTLFGINDVFKTYLPELNVDELVYYPNVYNERKIKAFLNDDFSEYKIIPASGAGIIKKSVNTRGIINELESLSNSNDFSNPLKTLFGKEHIIKKNPEEMGKVPGILSNTQYKILENVPLYPISLIIGPPGTGKSYTVATLAAEQMSKGKSILIASRTDQAVNVIAEKIENQLGIMNVAVRGGRSKYLKDLKKYLQKILSGIYKKEDSLKSRVLYKKIDRLEGLSAKLEKKFKKQTNYELKRGKFISEKFESNTIFDRIRKKYIIYRTKKIETQSEILSKLEKTLEQINQKTIKYIEVKHSENIEDALRKNRNELNNLLKALNAKQGTKQEEFFKMSDFKYILKVFPIWLVKMSDINKVLPLTKELFDIAVIDEATQCDAASSIPIIQRAKHTVFTGDPNQLRHVSFLSGAMMQDLKEKFELKEINSELLDYRHNSILDMVSLSISNQDQVFFLDEHFRSYPSIIRFSNEKFYSGALKIMKESPNIAYNEGIIIKKCNSKKSKQGYNQGEAEGIINEIVKIVEREKELNENMCSSIGVLSPFRNQVEFILKIIENTFELNEIKKHQIRAATAYGFQGDERDIMFLSFVLDNHSHSTAFRYASKEDVFNVSITRAKNQLYIYHSLDTDKLSNESLLKEYLISFNEDGIYEKSPVVHDDFIDEISEIFERNGIMTWKAFPVAGLKIDLIVKVKERIYGIDIIGFPGEFADAFSVERYKMLQRAGLKTIPLSYTFWKTDKKRCEENFSRSFGIQIKI